MTRASHTGRAEWHSISERAASDAHECVRDSAFHFWWKPRGQASIGGDSAKWIQRSPLTPDSEPLPWRHCSACRDVYSRLAILRIHCAIDAARSSRSPPRPPSPPQFQLARQQRRASSAEFDRKWSFPPAERPAQITKRPVMKQDVLLRDSLRDRAIRRCREARSAHPLRAKLHETNYCSS